MSKVKSNLVKLFACVFAVCAAFAIATMPKANVVGAASEPSSFEVVGTSIRNGEADGLTGLRFTTKVTDAWLSENSASTYSFGTLIAPTDKLGEFDSNKTPTENMDLLDGDNIIAVQKQALSEGFEFTASIIYDEQVVIDYLAEKGSTVSADEILANLYKKSFTAIPYAMLGNEVIYADAYSESMYNTALKTVALAIENEDQDLMMLGAQYVGISGSTVQSAYVSVKDNTVVVDSVDGFQASEETALLVGGEVLVLGEDYTLDAQGNIILTGELQASATPEYVYVVDNGYIHAVDVLYANNVLKTAEDVKNFFDATTWAEDATHYNEVTVLANDVDMSTVSGDYGVSSSTAFKGYFDGRGHVISNFVKNTTENPAPIFGDLANNAVIKNIAFDNFSSVGHNVNNGWFGQNLRGTVENIYVKFAHGSESQQMFMYTKIGHLNNVIIETPYDEELDVDAWITANSSAWGRTYLARMIESAGVNNMNNVHVISQLPLVLYGTGSMAEPVYTEGSVSDWKNWFAYGENETKVWYDFDYFHNATDDATAPGLGLEEGAQTVQNTQVIVDEQSMKQGKTRVWNGVKRYDTLAEMVANNPDSVSAFLNTDMWKMDNGALVWAKGNIKDIEIISTVDYDASTSELKTTAWAGETIQKVTLNGAQLTAEENGGLVVDEGGNFIGIRAKTSASDTLPGIAYVRNGQNRLVSCNIVIETAEKIIYIYNVQYWSQIIYDKADLIEALNVDYTSVDDTAGTEEGTHTYEGNTVKVINGNNKITTFNVGIYKLTTDIDMEKTGIEYASELGESSEGGGFNGYFNGMGYSILNFAPTTAGLFNTINHYAKPGSGISLGYAATIENLAFENVITANDKPVIARNMGQQATGGNHKLRNIYVNYSSESTGSCGILRFVGQGYKGLNNVYVINNNTHNMINLNDQYRFYEREGVTVDDGLYLNPLYKGTLYNGALFGNLYKSTSSANNQQNVYVVSKLPIAHYNETQYPYSYSVYRNGTTVIYKEGGYLGGTFTKNVNVSTTNYKTYAYAENETLGRIPVIYKMRENIVTEFTNDYATLNTNISSRSIYYCPVCGESTLVGAVGNDCATVTGEGEDAVTCEGKLVAATGGALGCFGQAVAYEWTLHLPKTEGVQTWDANNGTLRFLGVYKYDTIEDMKAVDNDFSSFTGEDGNGMWNVVEGELVWVGAQA